MKNIFLGVILFFTGLGASAQQYHFMYLENQSKQPFYVIMDGKVYSSSLTGYLILSKLLNTNYKLTVGFPKNAGPKLTFNYLVKNKDAGFEIRDYGEKGWGLLNLQSLDVIMAGNVIAYTPPPPRETTADPFSNMLANVVHDSSINKKEVPAEQPKIETVESSTNTKEIAQATVEKPAEPKTISGEVKSDTTQISKQEQPVVVVEKSDPKPFEHIEENSAGTTEVKVFTPSSVVRKSRRKNKEGLQLVYIDKSNGQVDTINVEVPNENLRKKKVAPDAVVQNDSTRKADVAVSEQKKVLIPEAVTQTDTSRKVEVAANEPQKVFVPVIQDSTPLKQVVSTPTEKVLQDTVTVAEVNIKDVKVESKPEAVEKIPAIVQSEATHKEPKFIDLKDPAHPTMINSDCKAVASDDDFLKLRKKMVVVSDDDDMIRVAKKAFKVKCYTTEQVRNLGALLLKDEGKYAFYEAAYPYVSDTEQFATLEKQLGDTYYINRFKAMIHH